MYHAKFATLDEQEQIVRTLRGWQFDREEHGCLYDRGRSDRLHGRGPNPHYGGVNGGWPHAEAYVSVRDRDEGLVKEYMAGYNDAGVDHD
jgi:hypothetical protein